MSKGIAIIGSVALIALIGLVYIFSKYLPCENLKTQNATATNLNMESTYYAVFLLPIESKTLTEEVIAKHAVHLRQLDTEGKLVLAGPFTDDPSGLLVLRGKNKEEIKLIMEQDPLIQGGFRTFQVRTWLMSNRGNNYHP